jgi:iron complex transport system substrate-binding protein
VSIRGSLFRRTLLGRAAAVVAVAGLALTGCGSGTSSSGSSASPGASYPVTVKTVTLAKQPTRIVSLSPTLTEDLFAVGAGTQVKAVDDQSDYPASAPKTKLSGFTPNAEAIAGYQPDLVVLSYDTNNVVAGLTKLKIPVYVANAATTLDQSYQQLADLGKLTGHAAKAADVVDGMKKDIAAAVKSVPKRAKPLTYYYELDPQLHSATSKTFIGALFGQLGLTNIADPADKDGSGYPQLSAEFTVKADPDLIFLADTKCCGQSDAVVAKRPGWSGLTAVKDHRVIALDDDVASRWGPRVVQLVQAAATAVKAVPAS